MRVDIFVLVCSLHISTLRSPTTTLGQGNKRPLTCANSIHLAEPAAPLPIPAKVWSVVPPIWKAATPNTRRTDVKLQFFLKI